MDAGPELKILDEKNPQIDQQLKLAGRVNRLDAWLAVQALEPVLGKPVEKLVEMMNRFPGVSRRFEQLAPRLYTDYAHTPPKIRGAIQLAQEFFNQHIEMKKAGIVIVYEGLHNTRQHFIKDELADLFDDVKKLYVVPSHLAREDKDLELLTPEKILDLLSISAEAHAEAALLNGNLAQKIRDHLKLATWFYA